MPERVVLAPSVGFIEISAALAGWAGGPTDLVPMLGGEPIAARWTRGGAEIRYSANPALGLRVLEGSGLAEIGGRLPTLTGERAALLTSSSDRAESLLGVTALGVFGDMHAMPTLQRLAASEEPGIRGAAELAIRRIGLAALATGAERVGDRRTAHPDRDPVLGLLVPVSVRRQVLRQILAEPPADRARLRDLLAAGLADEDWEVRWSAVLGLHDHRVSDLLVELRHCAAGKALDAHDREVLEGVRDVVGHRLAGTRSSHPGAPRIAALLDGSVDEPDVALLLLTALREPVPSEQPSIDGFVVIDTVAHWLGGPHTPIRRVTPAAPFVISVCPQVDIEADAVTVRLRELSAATGRSLRLPTADELEMATRGPDGRRFPWGNGRERNLERARSSWGLARPLATPEWVDEGGHLVAIPEARHGCGAAPFQPQRAGLRAVLVS